MTVSIPEVAPIEECIKPTGRSPFERTLLPGFAAWFADLVEELKPDLIIPIEIKGARLLEAAAVYARRVLGRSLKVPVLYTPALTFADPAELGNKRVLLLDDAARTGTTLDAHKDHLSRYGVVHLDAAVCVLGGEQPLTGVHAYCRADEAAYREYLFQLAELVVARGLPPEIDHHVYTLTTRRPLVDVWSELIESLSQFGELSLDGSLTSTADIESMTLHFPVLPSMPRYPLQSPARDQGAKKLRLFLDGARQVIHVVPVVFAALDLPAGVDPADLPEQLCLEVVRSWTQGRGTIAEELIARARTRDAYFLFRLLSTVGELDLIDSFARLLGSQLADGVVALASERPLLARLYGPAVAEFVADSSDAAAATAFKDSASQTAAAKSEASHRSHPLLRLDTSVVAATREVATYLKALYVAERNRADFDPQRRVGLTLVELSRSVPPEGIDALMLSRCIDYGLARTTLVPFTDVEVRDNGAVRVRRKYRVAEASRSDQDYEDVETMRREEGEELIALTASTLAKRTDLWPNGLVPYEVVACALALLRAVLPNINGSTTIVYSPSGPRLMLGEPANLKSVYSLRSRHFHLNGENIAPTDEFMQAHTAKRLALDRRHVGTVEIESYLKTIATVLSRVDDPAGVLLSWALAAQPRMGLDVIDHHIRRAIEYLVEPLNEILRGEPIGCPKLTLVIKDARELLDAASETISRLEDDRVRSRIQSIWPSPDRAEGELQVLANAPTDPSDLLRLARQACECLKEAAEALLNLAKNEASAVTDTDTNPQALSAVEAMVTQEFRLTNVLRTGPASADRDPMYLAAEAIKRVIDAARSRSSAVAGICRGVPRPTGSSYKLPSPRRATIMVVDLAGWTATSVRLAHDAAVDWGNQGLELVDQWARAFSGAQVGAREGDAIRLEFASADAALLCAAAVQRHLLALRSTGRAGWRSRVAIDTGEISDTDGYNTLGRPINVASKLVKFCAEDDSAFDRVLLTPTTAQGLCARLREGVLVEFKEVFEIAPDYAADVQDKGLSFRPFEADAAATIAVLLSEPEAMPR